MSTDLFVQMIERADADGLPEGHDLRTSAQGFNDAAHGFYGDPQTVSVKDFIGRWARARKVWCQYTGESLL